MVLVTTWKSPLFPLLRLEIPSDICAKLRTVAASNNRVHMPWSLSAYASHYVQSFTCWYRKSFHVTTTLLLLVRATYMYGVVLHTHPVRGESHNQRNTTGEAATPLLWKNPSNAHPSGMRTCLREDSTKVVGNINLNRASVRTRWWEHIAKDRRLQIERL